MEKNPSADEESAELEESFVVNLGVNQHLWSRLV